MKFFRVAALLLAGCVAFLGPGPAAAADGTAAVEVWMDGAGALWRLTPETFLNQERAPLFNWLAKDTPAEARYPGYRNSPKLTFLNQPVVEGYARFANGTLASLYLSLYNRGDSGGTREPEFVRQVADLQNMISRYNRFAKKARARKIILPAAGVIDLGEIFSGLDPAAYKTYRCEGEKTDYRRFLRPLLPGSARINPGRVPPSPWERQACPRSADQEDGAGANQGGEAENQGDDPAQPG